MPDDLDAHKEAITKERYKQAEEWLQRVEWPPANVVALRMELIYDDGAKAFIEVEKSNG